MAVGELIYYRVAFLVPEGDTNDASVVINLPTGLSFQVTPALHWSTVARRWSARMSFCPPILVQYKIDLDITDLEQSLLAADLSNAATAPLRTH